MAIGVAIGKVIGAAVLRVRRLNGESIGWEGSGCFDASGGPVGAVVIDVDQSIIGV